MSESFEIIPLDTLFFRGSTPMESGMMNVVSVFPPPVSVIKGAFWTALHSEKGDFSDGLVNGEIPLEVTGIFIKKTGEKGSRYYAPAPATWYYDNDKKISSGEKLDGIKLIEAKKMQEMKNLGMTSSAGEEDVVFVKAEKDSKSLSGAWVSTDFLREPKQEFGKDDVLFEVDILSKENRTNVALDSNRKAKDGQLFSSTHLRLNDGISLVVCFKEKVELPADEGKLFFGGEKRISKFKRISEDSLNSVSSNSNGEVFVSFVPVEATKNSVDAIVSSGKIFATAGWDFAKEFHKPTTNWIPAGAVFNAKINDSCVALKSVPAK